MHHSIYPQDILSLVAWLVFFSKIVFSFVKVCLRLQNGSTTVVSHRTQLKCSETVLMSELFRHFDTVKDLTIVTIKVFFKRKKVFYSLEDEMGKEFCSQIPPNELKNLKI